VDQTSKTSANQVRHATGRQIFDVIVHRMGVSARFLESATQPTSWCGSE